MTAKKCLFCGGKADLLCDSKLGWERMWAKMDKEAPSLRPLKSDAVPVRYRAIHTCDAPLCRACAVPAGSFIAHLRGGRTIADTTDYCPGHDFGTLRREVTGLEAEAMRKDWRAQAMRRRGHPAAEQRDLFEVVP
jgi:hypothetical protein